MIIALTLAGRKAGPDGLVGAQIADKNILEAIGVAGDDVAGLRPEGHKTAVSRDGGGVAPIVRVTAGRVDRNAGGFFQGAVVNKDIGLAVIVISDQIGGRRRIGDITSVCGNRRVRAAGKQIAASLRGLSTGRTETDPLRGSGQAIMDKNVLQAVGVVDHQVRSFGSKHGVTAIKRQIGLADTEGKPVGLYPARADADTLGETGGGGLGQ